MLDSLGWAAYFQPKVSAKIFSKDKSEFWNRFQCACLPVCIIGARSPLPWRRCIDDTPGLVRFCLLAFMRARG